MNWDLSDFRKMGFEHKSIFLFESKIKKYLNYFFPKIFKPRECILQGVLIRGRAEISICEMGYTDVYYDNTLLLSGKRLKLSDILDNLKAYERVEKLKELDI